MNRSHRYYIAATAMAAGLIVAVPLAGGPVRAADKGASAIDPGFNPDTGQINLGVAVAVPSQSTDIVKIPTVQEARAALMAPVSTQPSTGEAPAAPAAATTGAATPSDGGPGPAPSAMPPPMGPIGSIGQTLPAKFSQRNEVLDRVPIMAWPLSLSDQQRQQIYEAVMADKTQPAPGADALMPSSALTIEQALDGMHELPANVRDIAQVQGLAYVKGKSKVLLVRPPARTVVDEIGQ